MCVEILKEEKLYDLNNNEIGYIYDISKDNIPGYAITIREGDTYYVNETAYGTKNQYNRVVTDAMLLECYSLSVN